MLGAIGLTILLWTDLVNVYVWLVLGVMVWFGAIGAYDDWRKIKKKNSKGLSARGKMVLQLAGALLAGLYLYRAPGFDGHLSVPFIKEIQP